MTNSILFIGLVWPEPNSSAAGTRILQLTELFHKNGFEITFATAAQESEYMADLSTMGITQMPIILNSDTFDAFLADLKPSIVVFDRFVVEEQFGWRVAASCPGAIRILDTEDLHCLRAARTKAVRQNEVFKNECLLEEEVAKREIASILRCDLSLIISEFEFDLLVNLFKIEHSQLMYLPLFAKTPVFSSLPNFYERKDFGFIGNFLHEPNFDAVRYMKRDIWPLIRNIFPDATLNVYGAYQTSKTLQLNDKNSGFHIRGRAADAFDVLKKSRVLLAPIRFGAGIKGKFLDAMQSGTPSVTSSVGAEGINSDLPWSGAICDDPNEFARAAVYIYHDEEAWHRAQRNSVDILKRFDSNSFSNKLLETIIMLRNNLQRHRKLNFMGSLLMHHTLASTKYMSKWIEEKNKIKNPAD